MRITTDNIFELLLILGGLSAVTLIFSFAFFIFKIALDV